MGTSKGSGRAAYDSHHGATRKITAAAKLVELACERIAQREGKPLPARFWLDPQWKTHFKRQTLFANSLLKLFDETVVITAFRANPGVWSLGASFFLDDLKSLQRDLNAVRARAADADPIRVTNTTEKPRGGVADTGSIRAKLNRLDATTTTTSKADRKAKNSA